MDGADEIAEMLRIFEVSVCRHARQHTLTWKPGYAMNPLPNGASLVEAITHRVQMISVQKRESEWSLWFREAPVFIASGISAPTAILLRDASLSIRELFLLKHAKAFAEEFLELCRRLPEQRRQALEAGRAALEFLDAH